VVSHDRDFLDGLVSKVYEFRDNRIRENIGGIYDFLRKKKIVSLREIEKKDRAVAETRDESDSTNKQKYLEKKELERNLRKLRRRLEDSEKEIERMEKELAVLDAELARTATSPESADIFIKYEDLRKKLDTEMENWTRYSHDVDEFLKNNE
jgi:ATP-binding cassette subfamily F protein 3